jgi:hypothetical protein
VPSSFHQPRISRDISSENRGQSAVDVFRGWSDLLESLPSLVTAAELTESSGEPAIGQRVIGVRSDHPFRRVDRSLVLATVVVPDSDLEQLDTDPRIAGIGRVP